MTKRENLISLLRRQGIKEALIDFQLCPSLYEIFNPTFPRNSGFRLKIRVFLVGSPYSSQLFLKTHL